MPVLYVQPVPKRLLINLSFNRSGELGEVFGSGTAAVVSSLSMLHYQGTDYEISGGKAGPLTRKFFDTLTAIQYGAAEDPHG